MSGNSLPSNWRNILFGVFAAATVVTVIVLLAVSLAHYGPAEPLRVQVLLGEPTVAVPDVLPEVGSHENRPQFDFRLETEMLELNGDGKNVVDNCCLIRAGDYGGTGFIIEPNLLITAAHVIEDFDSERLVKLFCAAEDREPTPTYFGEIIVQEPDFDVAVIRIQGRSELTSSPLMLQSEMPSMFQSLHMYGFEPAGVDRPNRVVGVHRGTLLVTRRAIGRRDEQQPTELMILSNLAASGNSGGPVFDDYGEVVGMITENVEQGGLTVAVPAFTIKSVLLFNGLIQSLENN